MDVAHGDTPQAASHGSKTAHDGPNVATLERPGCELLPQKTTAELWEVAQCYFKLGLTPKASDVLKEIARRDPHDLEAFFTASWMVWSDSLTKQGDLEEHYQNEALEILNQAVELNSTDWQAYVERGDHYYLRLGQVTKAYADYIRARKYWDGERNVKAADIGRKASIEARIARAAEKLDRKGEAVEASCGVLFYDPDDKGSRERIERLHGSCTRKKVADPRTEAEKKASEESSAH